MGLLFSEVDNSSANAEELLTVLSINPASAGPGGMGQGEPPRSVETVKQG